MNGGKAIDSGFGNAALDAIQLNAVLHGFHHYLLILCKSVTFSGELDAAERRIEREKKGGQGGVRSHVVYRSVSVCKQGGKKGQKNLSRERFRTLWFLLGIHTNNENVHP